MMNPTLQNLLKYSHSQRSRYVDQLGSLVSIPSVSLNQDRRVELVRAAEWLADTLNTIGMDNVTIYPLETHPFEYAENLSAGRDAPTVLIYGHYDVQPALDVNGMHSGFIGEGLKTVLPANAMAKISCRLVPFQDPEKIKQGFEGYLEENVPDTIRWDLNMKVGIPAAVTSLESPWIKTMARAQEIVFGRAPILVRGGGSLPVVPVFQNMLGADSVNIGATTSSDNVHGPNERFHLPNFTRLVDTLIVFFDLIGKGQQEK